MYHVLPNEFKRTYNSAQHTCTLTSAFGIGSVGFGIGSAKGFVKVKVHQLGLGSVMWASGWTRWEWVPWVDHKL
jgi:hypothetical protein